MISGIVEKNHATNAFISKHEGIDINEMLNGIVSANDESNITIRFICKSLGKCVKTITNKNAFLSIHNLRWAIQIIARLLCITKNDTYWLVVVEV